MVGGLGLLVAVVWTGALAPRADAGLVALGQHHVVGVLAQRGINPASIKGSYARRPTAPLAAVKPATSASPPVADNLTYHGGPVLHAEAPYLIFWDPNHEIATADRA
ncbi:MAG: hypothetical protein M3016_07420, partial [Actinomycetota bacterium]|nr:hypothetical protein [Actinomycetota bacterium]